MSVDSWWDHKYPIRLPVNLDSGTSLIPVGHPIYVTFDKDQSMGMGKVRRDFVNLEVVAYTDAATPQWAVLSREITETSTSFTVKFNCVDSFEGEENDKYFVYYGRNISQAPSRPDFDAVTWPNEVDHNGVGVSYTKPGEYWLSGVSDVSGAIATFSFTGPRVGLFCNKGNYGILEVKVNEQDWESIDLYSQTAITDTLVWSWTGSGTNTNTVKVRCTGAKSPQSSSAKINISHFRFESFIEVKDINEEVDIDVNWTSIIMGGDNG